MIPITYAIWLCVIFYWFGFKSRGSWRCSECRVESEAVRPVPLKKSKRSRK